MIRKYTGDNGLRIILENIPTVRSVTIGIFVQAGSRNETIKNNGISHFLEHMFFKGTKTRSAQDIAEAFDAIGGQVNAFTTKEYTCFFARVLDTHKETALAILADMFFHSAFDQEEIEKEKKVVYEEINMYEDTPDDIVHDLLAKAAYGNHPLGFPILGAKQQLESFTRDTLLSYVEERYTPDNIVISIAGNADEQYVQEVDKYFGKFMSDGTKEQSMSKPSFHTDELLRSKDTEQTHFCLGYNGLPLGNENVYSLAIMNNVLGGSMSSRLFQEIREKKGLAYAVFSYHSSFLDHGLLTIYAGTGNDQLPELQDTIYSTIENLLNDGLTTKELKNSKEQIKGNLMLSLESTNSRMNRNGKNELLLRRHKTLDEMIKDIDAVSEESVNEIITSTFDQRASALIAPTVD